MVPAAVSVLVGALLLAGASACASGAPASKPEAASAPDFSDSCVVLDAESEPAGLAAERAWLDRTYPGSKTQAQDVGRDGERVLDILRVLDADGREHTVCFDITTWFGKF